MSQYKIVKNMLINNADAVRMFLSPNVMRKCEFGALNRSQ